MTKIYHAHLWGSRKDKFRYLLEHDITTVEWTELNPQAPFYLFIPFHTELLPEYEKGWKITEIMPEFSLGCLTKRDNLVVNYSFEETKDNILKFIDINKTTQ